MHFQTPHRRRFIASELDQALAGSRPEVRSDFFGFALNILSSYQYVRVSAAMLFDMRLALYRHLQILSSPGERQESHWLALCSAARVY